MTDYIHHTDNTIDRAAGPLPTSWGGASGLDKASGSSLKEKGWLPVVDSGSASDFTAAPTGVSVGDAVTPDADNVTRTYALKSASECVAIKVSQINALRDQKRYPGDLETGLGWDVDLRNATDESNIRGKALKAVSQQVADDSTAITFMGADDTPRNLTPAQMAEVGNAVDAYISSVYAQSWVHKAALATMLSNDATAAEVVAYDIEADW
jgi:hypothetical protein